MPDRSTDFLELIRINDLANLGPDPRASRFPRNRLNPLLETWITTHAIPECARPALTASALLWHDHLDDAHALAQDISSTTGSFLHAIVHRREPDYDNARYWFHRVGRHEAFNDIARAATPFLVKQRHPEVASKLMPNGLWDPFAFIDACAGALREGSTGPHDSLLRHIQRIEFESIVGHLLSS